MKIIAITDIHGNKNAIKRILDEIKQDVDLILVCGDITHFGSVSETEAILKEITSRGFVTYFIPGNCDNVSLLDSHEIGGAINIHGRVQKYKELAIAGIGGAPITPFNTNIELSENEFKTIIQDLENNIGEQSSWILCAHSPPYGTAIDRLYNGHNAGSKTIREFIEREKPLISIHGHIHEARGKDKIGDVTVINPGPARSRYYAIIDILPDFDRSKIRVELKRAG